MRVEVVGDGEPEVAVVGGIHGDEPCGVRAIERLLSESVSVVRPVKFIVANELALERGVRYVDADLNRVFPGDADAEAHERRLAAELADELDGLPTFSMHSTQSYAEPFAITQGVSEFVRDVCPHLSIVAAVDAGKHVNGRLFEVTDVVEVECGLQGSEQAAENATRLAREFLIAMGVLPGDTVERDVPVFRLVRPIPKPTAEEYTVFAENFERLERGDVFAAADDREFTADESFYPVLMSSYGYQDVFGYAAEKVGTLS